MSYWKNIGLIRILCINDSFVMNFLEIIFLFMYLIRRTLLGGYFIVVRPFIYGHQILRISKY